MVRALDLGVLSGGLPVLGYLLSFGLGVIATFAYHYSTRLMLTRLLRSRRYKRAGVFGGLLGVFFVFKYGILFLVLYLSILWFDVNPLALIAGMLSYQIYILVVRMFWPERFLCQGVKET